MTLLTLEGGWASFLEGSARDRLEREVLPAYLPRQRWFAGKARTIESARVVDGTPQGTLPGTTMLLFVEVGYMDGTAELYFLPLHLCEGGAPAEGPSVLARTSRPEAEGTLCEALADDTTCATLLAEIEKGQETLTQAGLIRGIPTSVFGEARGPAETPLPITRGKAEQSNSAVIYGDRLIMKVFRRLEPGLNPDFEIGRFLSERTSFDRAPKCAGLLAYERRGVEPITLAIVQELVKNQGTGWEHALGVLARYYDAVARRTAPPPAPPRGGADLLGLAGMDPPPEVLETAGEYLPSAATLGRRTAELHLALASDPDDPAFAPEPLTPEDLDRLLRDVRDQADRVRELLAPVADAQRDPSAELARRVLEGVAPLLDRLERTPLPGAAPQKIRCHGDYHLGQVLWADRDFILLDFEGEPAKPLTKRREKQSPIKDVVGMLRSFDYAAYAGLFAHAGDRAAEFDRLTPWARAWASWTSASFLRSYLATAAGAPFLPGEAAGLASLLQLFTLDKALYELLYELNNRPDWVRIPLRGIAGLLDRGTGKGTAEG